MSVCAQAKRRRSQCRKDKRYQSAKSIPLYMTSRASMPKSGGGKKK